MVPSFLFFRHCPQAAFAGPPEGRSSDRSSSSKIGPEIEIDPLLGGATYGERRGGAGTGKDGTPTCLVAKKITVSLLPRSIETTILNVSSKARTTEFICKPMEDQNVRLTRGLSAGPRRLFVSGC